MTHDDILKKINSILCDLLDDENIHLTDATSAEDVEEWDSLVHVRLIIAIESAFKVRFDTKEITSSANVGELVDLIQSKMAPA